MIDIRIGIIEDINDPEKIGRVRVRVFGIHDINKNNVPISTLPWMSCLINGFASISGIGLTPRYLKGSQVLCYMFNDFQEGIVLGSINSIPKYFPDKNKGFNDPDGKYPAYIDESDLNRLSRNENINKTIVNKKNNELVTGINIANSEKTWDEPKTEYGTIYPNNQVLETEGGHIFELDDTEDKKRIHMYHNSGSFFEINNSGIKVQKIINDNYELIYGDDYINVKGNVNITIDGDCLLYIKGDSETQIDGNVNQKVSGDITQDISGSVNQKVSGDITQDISGSVNQNISSDLITNADGNINITSSGEISLNATKIKLN